MKKIKTVAPYFSTYSFSTTVAIFAMLGATLGACGKNQDPVDVIVNPIKAGELLHTWHSNCGKSKLLDVSVLTEYKFSGSEVKETQRFFSDAECKVQAAHVEYSGKFEVRTDANPKQIDLQYNQVIGAADNADGKKVLELVNFCGVTDWTEGKVNDVTANSTNTACPLREVPKTRFEIYTVENDVLFLGTGYAEGKADAPAERPVEFKKDAPFRRID